MMKERLKTISILLLSISAAYLTLRTWVYDSALLGDTADHSVVAWLLGEKPDSRPGRFAPVRWQYEAALEPYQCSVMTEEGRMGVMGSAETMAVYRPMSVTLGEAMNTAASPRPIDAEEWAALMRTESLYFHFNAPVSLTLLSAWLGVGSALDAAATGIGLSFSPEGDALVYQDDEGRFFAAAADVLWNGFPVLPTLTPCAYAFERPELSASPPWQLLIEGMDSYPLLRLSGAASYQQNMTAYAAFLQALEIDPVSTPSYTSEGARVYADGNRICRLLPEGGAQYVNPEPPSADSALFAEDSERPAASRVERARALAATLAPLLGDGQFSLSGVREQEGATVVEMVATVNGIPLAEPRAYAIITVSGGVIRQAEIRLNHHEMAEEAEPLLPLEYALVWEQGAALTLCYRPETEDGLYTAYWAKEER